MWASLDEEGSTYPLSVHDVIRYYCVISIHCINNSIKIAPTEFPIITKINFNKLTQDRATKKYGKSDIQYYTTIRIHIITAIEVKYDTLHVTAK